MLNKLFSNLSLLKKHRSVPFEDKRERYLLHLFHSKKLSIRSLHVVAYQIIQATKLFPPYQATFSTLDIERMADKWVDSPGSLGRRRTRYHFVYHTTDWLLWCNMLREPHVDSVLIFNEAFAHREVRRPHILAPFLEERIAYLNKCKEGGTLRRDLQRVANYQLHIIKYLKLDQCCKVSLSEISAAAILWALDEKVKHRHELKLYEYAKSDFIRKSKQWLSFIGYIEVDKQVVPFEEYLNKYIVYLKEEKGFSQTTIKGSYHVLKIILAKIEQNCSQIEDITPPIIDDVFVKLLQNKKYQRCSIAQYSSKTRDFFRYAEQNNWCCKGLAASIYSPRIYTHENIPYAPQWSDIKKIIDLKLTDKPIDIRDCAILQLIAVYGLRSGEAVNLKIKDIDWRKETIYVHRGKGSRPQIFPLMRSVGMLSLDI